MRPYELMFIISPDVEGDEAVDGYVERVGQMIAGGGGNVTAVDKWGKKRLAYEIKGYTEGYYVVVRFEAGASVVAELNRVLRITDGVVRHLIVRLDERLLKNERAKPAEEPKSEGEAVQAAPQAAEGAAEPAAPAEQAEQAEADAPAGEAEQAGQEAAATN